MVVQTPVERTLLRQAKTSQGHYVKYIEKEKIYIENVETEERNIVSRLYGKEQPMLAVDLLTEVQQSVSREGLAKGETLPYTYTATLETSRNYLRGLLDDGWSIQAEFATYEYIDYFLRRDEEFRRIIVLQSIIKIFDNVDPTKIPDPLHFMK